MYCSKQDVGHHAVACHHITFCIVQIKLVPALARCRSTSTCISGLYYAVAISRPSILFQPAAVCTSVPWFSRGSCIDNAYWRWLGFQLIPPWKTVHRAVTRCIRCIIVTSDPSIFYSRIPNLCFLKRCQYTQIRALPRPWLLDFDMSLPCLAEEARLPLATTNIIWISTLCILSAKRRRHTTE